MRDKVTVFYLAVLLLFILSGCAESLFKPSATFTVDSVDPYLMAWEAEGEGASATYTLPNLKISLRNDTPIPANLVSTQVLYSTKTGEIISQLPPYSNKQELALAGNSTTEFEVAIYYPDLFNFISYVSSDIYPINAAVKLNIIDINENTISVEANCQVYRPDISVSYTPPTSTVNQPTTPTIPATPVGTGTANLASVKINLPSDGASLPNPVFFSGIASPSILIESLKWESSRDGVFETAVTATLTRRLRVGEHTISFSGKAGDKEVKDSIKITITQ